MKSFTLSSNPNKTALALTLGLSALVSSVDAYACAACGCTLSKDWETQGLSTTQGFSADLSIDYIKQDQQRYGTGKASQQLINDLYTNNQEIEDYTTTRITTATLNYNSDIWVASLQLPFVQRKHGTFGGDGTVALGSAYSTSDENGLGDVRLIGRYTGLSADRDTGIIAGVKLPTGNTTANFASGDAAGTALDRSLQIGTGSTDVILGGFLTGTVNTYAWFVQGTVQHAVATKSIGGADYKPGDAYSLNGGLRYAKYGASFTPMLQFNLIHRQADTGEGATPADVLTGGTTTGGTLLYLAPGASMRVGGGTSIYGFVQLPLYQNVNSLQLNPRYTVTLGIHQSFE